MAKEVKSGVKKAVAKKSASAKKAAPAKKTVVTRRTETKKRDTMAVVYMFMLILGVSLIFVSLALKMTNEIGNTTVLYCLGIALASLIISAFIKKLND